VDSNVIFLDEALDGLDAQGKAQAMNLLGAVSRTRGVYLVDHTSEIKASVERILSVTYKDGNSELVA
jgi:DNA repair exonuclease SbcCD ATPase subunit